MVALEHEGKLAEVCTPGIRSHTTILANLNSDSKPWTRQ